MLLYLCLLTPALRSDCAGEATASPLLSPLAFLFLTALQTEGTEVTWGTPHHVLCPPAQDSAHSMSLVADGMGRLGCGGETLGLWECSSSWECTLGVRWGAWWLWQDSWVN